MRLPMLDEAVQDEAANAERGRQCWTRPSWMRPPMLDEAVLDEIANAGRGQPEKGH